MSATDINTQHTMFKKPYQSAIVIDPLNIEMRAYTITDIGFREKSFATYRSAAGKKVIKKRTVRTQSLAVHKKVLKVVS